MPPLKLTLATIIAFICSQASTSLAISIDEPNKQNGNKLGSVLTKDYLGQKLSHNKSYSLYFCPHTLKTSLPLKNKKTIDKVLLMGGIHREECSTDSILFKSMDQLNQYQSELFHWKVAPAMNQGVLLQFARHSVKM
ncbi:MAG: hypothetical protein ACJAUP_001485 [Cellvibrionaceae bacterium]